MKTVLESLEPLMVISPSYISNAVAIDLSPQELSCCATLQNTIHMYFPKMLVLLTLPVSLYLIDSFEDFRVIPHTHNTINQGFNCLHSGSALRACVLSPFSLV